MPRLIITRRKKKKSSTPRKEYKRPTLHDLHLQRQREAKKRIDDAKLAADVSHSRAVGELYSQPDLF